MNEIDKNKAFEKLTPERKALVERVLENLKNGDGLWQQGWINTGVPASGITGKKYHGINNFYLTLVSIIRGYSDNRWITYKQMEEKGWKFKFDEEGNSLGKGAGVAIEFFELRDKETKKPFDRKTLDGMTKTEQEEYFTNLEKSLKNDLVAKHLILRARRFCRLVVIGAPRVILWGEATYLAQAFAINACGKSLELVK